ncbi:MAG: GNAT family N-acetyltransferase [Bacteroidota bacterium]
MHIRTATISEILALARQIPEFQDSYPPTEYHHRLAKAKQLSLIAEVDGRAAGFKVGYEKEASVFYSWMGGVHPDFRRQGVAQALANAQEVWARKNGYHFVEFKTRNYLKPMLLFGIGNGFHIYKVEPREQLTDYRIYLRKEL